MYRIVLLSFLALACNAQHPPSEPPNRRPPPTTAGGMISAWTTPLSFKPVGAEYLAMIPNLKTSFIGCQFDNLNNHPAARAVRAAFHDAATHSVSLNTGGADGSLANELNADIDADFIPLISFYRTLKTSGTSLADIIVLGASVAISVCQGGIIPFAIGRRDTALAFNTNALPLTGERFGSIIAKFTSMGFTEREMTILSIGGHSIGAARKSSDLSASQKNRAFAPFDTTPTVFDNMARSLL